ncbi:MAG TPA: glycosyltransferase family 4 protein [Pedobacter sp.]|nr:glycosyltransferase family 4 protein [Pedobacter sp.]
MKVMLSHPQGSEFVRAAISAFDKAGMLVEFNTTLSFNKNSGWIGALPGSLRKELLRRSFPLKSDKIIAHPLREMVRMIAPHLGLAGLTRHETGWASVDRIYHQLDRVVAKRLPRLVEERGLDAVYCYEDGALETFTRARKLGLKCVYDLPIAYWETGRRLMQEEAERMPAWAATLGGGVADSAAKLERKRRELELADMVVVPGDFVKDSLPDWAKNKRIVVAPFGSPASRNVPLNKVQIRNQGPLRVLFAGSLGQRKGLGDLFAAMKMLDPTKVKLIMMGGLLAPFEFYRNEFSDFIFESGRPHDQVLELMRSCDVLCLPSIVEGRALVMQEAMSQGLPLLITPNTGGADLIIEGETGFMVPLRSPDKIAETLNWFAENREHLTEMSLKARKHAAGYTWEGYGEIIINELTR